MATTHPAAPAAASSVAANRLLCRFREVRGLTATLCAPLSAEDQMVQSCAEASPVKWHQAHTTWFFETFLLTPHLAGYQAFHPDFHWLFNSYYRSLGEEIPEKRLRASFSRPPLAQVLAYRAHVDAAMEQLLQQSVAPELLRLVELGLQHEQQHQELLLTDVKHAFFVNPLHPAYREREGAGDDPAQAMEQRWMEFDGGLQQIGYPLDTSDPLDFCFDNETPRHAVYLQPYAIADRLVNCAEFLAFMNADGYSRPELWLSEGWDTVEREGWEAPLYWQRSPQDPEGWRVFTMAGWQPLSALMHTPVCHVSLFEADAFARWRGCRLPTEAEWEHAAVSGDPRPAIDAELLETGGLHPRASRSGVLAGGCWQWTASPYTGYPGYRPLPGALGEYNGKFMSSQVVLRGGSVATPASHIRPQYRNFFSPATRWQFSGIRLARAFGDV